MFSNFYSRLANCLGVNFINVMFLTTHLTPNVMIDPTIGSHVILNAKILGENIALTIVLLGL